MENPTQDPPPSPETDTLPALADAAKQHRLSPAEEEKASALLCEQLKGGRAGITTAVQPLLAFPWIVSVNAIAAVWSDLSQPMQRHLVSSLAKEETEQARRLRLSLARAVFKLDPPAGVRLAIAVAADLRNPETGTLSTRGRQLFFHVFIGKGKPWLCLLPLEGAKGADALIHAALEAMPLSPPLSQLSILRWIHGSGRFKRLTPEQLELAAKAVGRWNYRFQQALKTDIPELPEVITAVLKPERTEAEKAERAERTEKSDKPTGRQERQEKPKTADRPEEKAEADDETTEAEPEEGNAEAPAEDRDRPEGEASSEDRESSEEGGRPRLSREERQAARRRERDARRDEQREQREQRRRERGERSEREPEGEKPLENARPPARKAFDPKTFDLRDTLRGVESYVASLRQEVEQTKLQLRRKDDESISSRRARRNREEAPNVDTEELTRHNARLEATIEDLRHQLEDLAAHHEAVAESRALHGESPLPEGSADQLRSLLNIKLHESYETFLAMKEDPLDRVFRLHYRDLLGSVFEVLQKEGVSLKKP